MTSTLISTFNYPGTNYANFIKLQRKTLKPTNTFPTDKTNFSFQLNRSATFQRLNHKTKSFRDFVVAARFFVVSFIDAREKISQQKPQFGFFSLAAHKMRFK